MKTKILLLLFIASFVGVGCSSKKSDATPPAVETPPVITDPIDPGVPGGGGTGGGLTSTGGDTVDFVPVDFAIFNSYVGLHPINSPKNIKLTVNLSEGEPLRYKGNVKISYEDNGQTFIGSFDSGTGKNYQHSTLKDNDKFEYHYNFWFKNNNVVVFSGYFQDKHGSIVVVIDKSLDQGDGQGSSYVSGSVYFKNFPQLKIVYDPITGRTNEQPWERKCWFIYTGPYVCGATAVTSKSALYPATEEGYRKLGTFSGLSRARAFNLK